MAGDGPGILTRLQHAWNVFNNKDPVADYGPSLGTTSYVGGIEVGPSARRRYFRIGADRTIVISVYNRLATDVALTNLVHARIDKNGQFTEPMDSGLNHILTVEANQDQTHREFIYDLMMSLFDEGVVAVIPVDTDVSLENASFDIRTMRTGRITSWQPSYVSVEAYNDRNGHFETVTVPKTSIGIIKNPFYDVMNAPNSTLQRLTRKLALLDDIDEQSGASKLDLILQLPYVIKRDSQRIQAEKRRKEIEEQLANSKYGIAYTDGTEKVVQLNRSVENNLMNQIQYLTSMLYSQLGLTEEIMNGTASESAMINYYNRTINPLLNAIVDEFSRKFLTKTARTRGQGIIYYREPFSLMTTDQLAEIADKLTRNEILAPNEIRAAIGYRPVDDERADELRNRNLNASDEQLANPVLLDRDNRPDEFEEDASIAQNEGGIA